MLAQREEAFGLECGAMSTGMPGRRRDDPSTMTAVILCGGRGTRAWPLTEDVPKPLLPVGDRPALSHVLEIYARQGVRRFLLAGGYKVERLRAWATTTPLDVTVLDTGLDAGTGERILACADHLDGRFFATYGDGLGNVALNRLLDEHVRRGRLATVTTVPLPSQYGTLEIDEAGAVRSFQEKPVLTDHSINAGFFVFERGALDAWPGSDLEREVLPAFAGRLQLSAYRHQGFWKSMDTQKDVEEMTRLANEEGCPWLST
jgi:glucose-1-phosphate cytidylyltransferase